MTPRAPDETRRPRGRPYLDKVTPYQPGTPIEEVKRRFGLKRVIKLASNENPYPPSPKAVQAVRRAARGLNRYPDGTCARLRAALSRRLKVSPDQLVFGNGSDEILVMAVRAFASRRHNVVTSKPSFLIYELAPQACGVPVRLVPLKGLDHDVDALLDAVDGNTRLLFLGHPDNPSGAYVKKFLLRRLLKRLPEDVLLVLDEAYAEYVAVSDYESGLSLIDGHENLLVTRTFSKLYALAGARIGYGVGSSRLIRTLEKVREPFNVNLPAQEAACAALEDASYYSRIVAETRRERRKLIDGIKRLGLTPVATETNFILVRTPDPARPYVEALLNRGVIVRDMAAWGMTHFFRVTIGRPEENVFFLRRLEAVVTGDLPARRASAHTASKIKRGE